jgi:O-antigen/teichoic acid export membrane protein
MIDSFQNLASRIARHPSYWPFLKSVGSVSVLRLAGGGMLFVSQMLLAGWMGSEAFGRYSFAWAWVTILATVGTLGLGATSVRFIAAYRATGQDHKVRGLIRFGRTVILASSFVITAAALIVLAIAPRSVYHGVLALAFLALPAVMILTLESAHARGFGWVGFSVLGAQFSSLHSQGRNGGGAGHVLVALFGSLVLAAAALRLSAHQLLGAHQGS